MWYRGTSHGNPDHLQTNRMAAPPAQAGALCHLWRQARCRFYGYSMRQARPGQPGADAREILRGKGGAVTDTELLLRRLDALEAQAAALTEQVKQINVHLAAAIAILEKTPVLRAQVSHNVPLIQG